jgi:ectoine hydroxylase-related dioxygenase (phytanoyl-CoA dioxygenase family)
VAHPDVDSQVEALRRDGYVYFPGVLNAAEIADLRAAMDRLEARAESFDRDGSENGYAEKHIKCVFNRDIHFLQFVDRPRVIEVVEGALTHREGRRPIESHIIGMTAWVTGPGRPDQDLHVDWLPFPLPEDVAADPRVEVPVMIATAHYYLDDLYEELSPTKFIPGSHRAGRTPDGATEWNGQGEQSLLCQAGDVVLFRSEVWHRGSANRSDETRYLLQVHYANRMIAQKFPPYLNRFQFDPDILAKATPRQRRLLGDHPAAAYD